MRLPVIKEKNKEKKGFFLAIFPKMGGGGFPIPKSKCQNSDKILTFFVKTKNDPYGLKCKINPKKFSTKGFPKGGWGVRHLGKIPKKICFF